jgi:glyoxylate/hydroxypyruvate reductase
MMNTLVIRVDPERRTWWKQTLQDLIPEVKVVLKDEDEGEYAPSDVKYAVVWNPPNGWLATFPNLKCVASVGAGVSHILKDPNYPRSVPIIRTVSESLRMRMTEYVVLHVLRFHRRLPEIEQAQAERKWVQYIEPLASDVHVGLLGLGNLGAPVAAALNSLGYRVSGWSRRGNAVDGVRVFTGPSGLQELLSEAEVLVCMLPQTPSTENILDGETFSAMPAGSVLINVGRGEHLVEAELLAALDSGHLRGATLDVFREEPLPAENPLWSNPKVLITGHTASAIEPATGGRVIADNLRAFMNGDSVRDIVDIEQGY